MLYLIKLSNLILESLFKNYNQYFSKTDKIFYDEEKPTDKRRKFAIIGVSNEYNDILSIDKNKVNLIIDYLMFMKDITSSIIHISRSDYNIQIEILSEYIGKKIENIDGKYYISSSDLINLLFDDEENEKLKDDGNKDLIINNNDDKEKLIKIKLKDNKEKKKNLLEEIPTNKISENSRKLSLKKTINIKNTETKLYDLKKNENINNIEGKDIKLENKENKTCLSSIITTKSQIFYNNGEKEKDIHTIDTKNNTEVNTSIKYSTIQNNKEYEDPKTLKKIELNQKGTKIKQQVLKSISQINANNENNFIDNNQKENKKSSKIDNTDNKINENKDKENDKKENKKKPRKKKKKQTKKENKKEDEKENKIEDEKEDKKENKKEDKKEDKKENKKEDKKENKKENERDVENNEIIKNKDEKKVNINDKNQNSTKKEDILQKFEELIKKLENNKKDDILIGIPKDNNESYSYVVDELEKIIFNGKKENLNENKILIVKEIKEYVKMILDI